MNPPLMQNSHDGGSPAALQLLVTAIFMWELLYQLFRFAIKLVLNKYPDLILNHSDKTELQQAKRNLIDRGPSYATSQVHAIYVSLRGILHLYNLHSLPNIDKLISPSTHFNDDNLPTCRWMHMQVATTNTLFLSYLLYDLCHVILQYPKLGGIDTILHHILFALCSIINGTYGIMAFPFGWLAVGEISTIFLNWRWILLKSNGETNSMLLNVVNRLFALAFFVTRNVIYSIGMVHLFWFSWEEVRSLPDLSGVPLGWLSVTVGCMFLGWALNFVWGCKILSMVMSGGGRKKEKKRQ